MKRGITLLTARGWIDGHVVEVKAQRSGQQSWTWNLTSITTGDHLAYGCFNGSARAMSAEAIDILEGANDGEHA